MIRSHFVKNSFTIWLKYFFNTFYLELINRRKNLKLGYKTNITKSSFGSYNTLYDHVVINNSKLGNFTYVANNSNIWNSSIGKFCSIGSNVKCGMPSHPSSIFVSTHPIFYSTLKQAQVSFTSKNFFDEENNILIGNDVWVGSNVIIMSGVTIADGAIIASGAVVTKDVPAYSIVGGVPAKIIKYRFEQFQIEFLLNLRWWDFEVNFLKNNFEKFHNINSLMTEFDKINNREI
jgi:acetyltransferase-like isoleucine patch superfamily enzyme